MATPPRPFTVVNRYLARQFLSLLLPILASFVLLYIIIDLFDRLDILLRHDASFSAAIRYFLFKIPLMLTQITPPAVITAALLTYGLVVILERSEGGGHFLRQVVRCLAGSLGASCS